MMNLLVTKLLMPTSLAILVAVAWPTLLYAQPTEADTAKLYSNSTRIQGAVQYLGEIPNCGLQLPRVSPDGRSIAYLQRNDSDTAFEPDNLITGRNLESLSLWVRSLDEDAKPRMVCPTGAAWPVWSTDSRTLVFIAYDERSRCSLRLHDMQAQTTRRLEVGLRRMMMPAVSPTGSEIAVAAYVEIPQQSQVFLIDIAGSRAQPIARDSPDELQLWPNWLDDHTLAFFSRDGDVSSFKRFMRGTGQLVSVLPLNGPANVFDAMTMFAGIPEPLDPNHHALAWYDVDGDRLITADLSRQATKTLPSGYRMAAWQGERTLIIASAEQLAVYQLGDDDIDNNEKPATNRPVRALPGAWAPIWADGASHQAIVVGQTEDRSRFRLARLWTVLSAEK